MPLAGIPIVATKELSVRDDLGPKKIRVMLLRGLTMRKSWIKVYLSKEQRRACLKDS
jgi:hypothetical protein